jgi:hypothetical protein
LVPKRQPGTLAESLLVPRLSKRLRPSPGKRLGRNTSDGGEPPPVNESCGIAHQFELRQTPRVDATYRHIAANMLFFGKNPFELY